MFKMNRYLILLLPVLVIASENKLFSSPKIVTAKKDTVKNCGCPTPARKAKGYRYYPSLGDRVNYATFASASKWQLVGEENSFDTLFIANDQFSGDDNSFRDRAMLISPRSPIKIIPPGHDYIINLTPCRNELGDYALTYNIHYRHQYIDEYFSNFDYKKFDYTTQSCVHLFLQMSGKRPDQIIRAALKEQGEHSDGIAEMNRSITAVNMAFNTGIPLVTEKTYLDSTTISGFLDSLVSKKLRQEKVLAEGFILSEPGTHRITDMERYRLENLFVYQCRHCEFALFMPEYLEPISTLYIENTNAILEISSNMLRPLKTGSHYNLAYNKLWLKYDSFTFQLNARLEMDITQVCLPPSVIGGTSIGIDFNSAKLWTDPALTTIEFSYKDYPQFKNQTEERPATIISDRYNTAQYDSLLTKFSGLKINQATLTIRKGKTVFKLNAANLLLNNRMIAGHIPLNVVPDQPGKIFITTIQGQDQPVDIPDLLLMLKKSGLNQLSTGIVGKQLYVYFKKINSKI